MTLPETTEIDGTEYRIIDDGEPGLTLEKESVHEKADELAADIERTLSSSREFLADVPEFEPRSEESRKLENKIQREQ